ncbi:MAG: response regulator transcription factor [Marinagarivorans sp.]
MSELFPPATLLLIEHEPTLASTIIEHLRQFNFNTLWATDRDDIIETLTHQRISLVIIAASQADSDDFSLCRDIRTHFNVPIILATTLNHEADTIKGFDSGADDYICKPISLSELTFRIKAILKRTQEKHRAIAAGSGAISLKKSERIAKIGNTALDLTPIEFNILDLLMQNPDRIFSRNDLLDRVYSNSHSINDRTIDSHIKNLRKKLALALPDKKIIQSVYGLGYRATFQELEKI